MLRGVLLQICYNKLRLYETWHIWRTLPFSFGFRILLTPVFLLQNIPILRHKTVKNQRCIHTTRLRCSPPEAPCLLSNMEHGRSRWCCISCVTSRCPPCALQVQGAGWWQHKVWLHVSSKNRLLRTGVLWSQIWARRERVLFAIDNLKVSVSCSDMMKRNGMLRSCSMLDLSYKSCSQCRWYRWFDANLAIK